MFVPTADSCAEIVRCRRAEWESAKQRSTCLCSDVMWKLQSIWGLKTAGQGLHLHERFLRQLRERPLESVELAQQRTPHSRVQLLHMHSTVFVATQYLMGAQLTQVGGFSSSSDCFLSVHQNIDLTETIFLPLWSACEAPDSDRAPAAERSSTGGCTAAAR